MKVIHRLFLASILILFYLLNVSHADTGTVIQVKDGDTVVITPQEGGAFYTCRLYGIDAPEVAHGHKPGQPYGEEALRELKKLVLGKSVDVVRTGQRTYNREVCIIHVNSTNVNLEMVRRGYAWAYRQYLRRPYASEYIEAENEARQKRVGLWKDYNPTPPWEFRKRQRNRK